MGFFIIFVFLINLFIITSNTQKKFFLFVVNLAVFTGIALYYQLDGLILIFVISELTIILVFLMLLSKVYTYEKTKQNKTAVFFIIMAVYNYNFYELNIVNYKNYYANSNIVFNDFFYVYNSFFEKYILLTLFILIIITLYSIFFILLFYQLKAYSLNEQKKKKNLSFVRKQNILHQTNFSTKTRIFKNTN